MPIKRYCQYLVNSFLILHYVPSSVRAMWHIWRLSSRFVCCNTAHVLVILASSYIFAILEVRHQRGSIPAPPCQVCHVRLNFKPRSSQGRFSSFVLVLCSNGLIFQAFRRICRQGRHQRLDNKGLQWEAYFALSCWRAFCVLLPSAANNLIRLYDRTSGEVFA